MTRIAVFSDTHGDLSRLDAAMRAIEPVDSIIHLGDFASDAVRMADKLNLPYHAVRGNCDTRRGFPGELVVHYEKTALLLAHGHQYPQMDSFAYKAEAQHCAAALFGHTHLPLLSAFGRVLLINPGSLSRPRASSKPSFCVLSITGAELRVQMVPLD